MTYEEYAALEGVRASRLKLMDQSPLHYREQPDNNTANRGMLRAIHALLLEPHTFDNAFATYDGKRDPRVKAYQAFVEANRGKTILTPKEDEQARATAEGFLRHDVARGLLEAVGECEETITWTHSDTGLACKARLDKRIGATIIDLKTYGTSDPRVIGNRVAALGAHIQAAHYCDGFATVHDIDPRDIRYLLIVAEDKAPFDVAVVELEYDNALALGRVKRDRLLAQIAECEASGLWPGRCPSLVPLDMPAWADPLLSGGDAVTFTEE